MTDAHPARSTAFLSRLYDGELDPAEAADFAAHRAGCAECRRAADAFAAALAAFRAEPTAPAAPDLSARILRKIRAQSPSRRPFGVTFGIDVRWAGVFVAALLVVLLAAPLLLRREPLAPAKPAAMTARLVDETPAPSGAAPEEREESRLHGAAPRRAPPAPAAPAAPPALAKDEGAARFAPAPASAAAPPPSSSLPEAPAEEEKRRVGLAAPSRQRAAAPRMSAEPSGGESANGMTADLAAAPPRIFVLAADGEGTPPPVVSRLDASRLSALRGREFVLLVETGGRVRSVAMPGSSAPAGLEAEVLREIVFAPGDRPRRLSVRIE